MKKPTITPDLLGTNPFIRDLVISINQMEQQGAYHNDDGFNIPVLTSREQNSRLTVYTSAKHRLGRNKLPLRSKELLLWLMDEAHYGEDHLWINWQRYEKELDVSRNTRVAAMKGLIDHQICQETGIPHVYWINPDRFFKGSRVNKYPNNLFHPLTGSPLKVINLDEKEIIRVSRSVGKVVKLESPCTWDFDKLDTVQTA